MSPTTFRAALLAPVALAVAACGGGHEGAGGAPAQVPPAAVYSVRGEVADLPAADRPQTWIAIRHEAIPDFVGITGEPEPMSAMTMRFPVAGGVDLGGLAAGDPVAFELVVDWGAGEPAVVVAIEPRAGDTALDDESSAEDDVGL